MCDELPTSETPLAVNICIPLPFSLETFLPGWKPQVITYPVFSFKLYRWKPLTKFTYTTTELYCFNFFFLIISIIFNFLLQGTVKFKKYGFLNGKVKCNVFIMYNGNIYLIMVFSRFSREIMLLLCHNVPNLLK